MTFLDFIYIAGTVIGFGVYASLMQRQNKLIERQNDIFDEQTRLMRGRKGKATMPVPTRAMHLKNYWPMLTMAGLTLLTWMAVGIDIYERRAFVPMSDLFLGYAGAQGPVDQPGRPCTANINGDNLLKYQTDYHVALTCGISDQTIDRLEDPRLAISKPFTIQSGAIGITVPFSNEMMTYLADHLTTAVTGIAKGTPATEQYPLWYQVILLPNNGCNVSDIRRLSDVLRCGGILLPDIRSVSGIATGVAH